VLHDNTFPSAEVIDSITSADDALHFFDFVLIRKNRTIDHAAGHKEGATGTMMQGLLYSSRAGTSSTCATPSVPANIVVRSKLPASNVTIKPPGIASLR
jgi:hypothetical protein